MKTISTNEAIRSADLSQGFHQAAHGGMFRLCPVIDGLRHKSVGFHNQLNLTVEHTMPHLTGRNSGVLIVMDMERENGDDSTYVVVYGEHDRYVFQMMVGGEWRNVNLEQSDAHTIENAKVLLALTKILMRDTLTGERSCEVH